MEVGRVEQFLDSHIHQMKNHGIMILCGEILVKIRIGYTRLQPLWRLYPCMGDIFNYYSPLYFFTNSMILDPGNLPLYFFMVSPIKAAEFRLGCLDIRLTMNDINSSSFVLYIEKSIVLPFAYSTMISIIASFARSPEFNFANILSASSLNLSNSTSISRLNLVFTSFGVETKISAIVTGFT